MTDDPTTPGPLGEAGARLRALVATWRGPAAQDAALRGYLETANTLQCCANELEATLDALLSAPVVSGWQLIAAKLVDEWGEGYVRFPGDELPEDWFMRMLALLREIAAPVVTQEGEEPCP